MSRTILTTALLTLAAGLTLSCGGTCRDHDAALQIALREQVARAGTGDGAVSGGEHHVGITYGHGLVSRLLGHAGELLGVEHGRLSVAASAERRRTAIRIFVQPRLRELELGVDPAEPSRVLVHGEVEVTVAIRTGRAADTIVPGQFQLVGRLELGRDEADVPALLLSVEGFGHPTTLGLQALDDLLAEAAQGFTHDALNQMLLERETPLALLRFPTLESVGADIRLLPTELLTLTDTGGLFLGFASNLRPDPGARVGPDLDVDSDGMSVAVHPGLPAAAARLSLVDGSTPARLDDELRADVEGDVRLTLDELRVLPEEFEMDYSIWDFRSGSCSVHGATARGAMRVAKDVTSMVVTVVAPAAPDDSAAWVFSDAEWLGTPFIVGTSGAAGRILDLGTLHTASVDPVVLAPDPVEADSWTIRMRYR